MRNIDDFNLANFQTHDLTNCRQSERFEGARDRDFAVADFHRQHLGSELFLVELLAQLEILDVVKKLDDFFVRAITERAQKRRREKLPAALATIEINIKQIGRIKLHFNPGAAIGYDSEAMPGERCNWLTTTRSAPLITKVPCGVISGISPM